MRTNTIIAVFTMITVHAKHLKASGILMVFKPLVKFMTADRTNFFSMFFPVVVDMVKTEKQCLCFTAAGTNITSVGLDGLVLQSVIVRERIFSSLTGVVFDPLVNFGFNLLFVFLIILLFTLAYQFFGFRLPFVKIGFPAILTLVSSPFNSNNFKAIKWFFNTACFANSHNIIITQFDYENQESVTTIPTGSRLQATGSRSAHHPFRMMIWSALTSDCKRFARTIEDWRSSVNIRFGNQLGVAAGLIFGIKKSVFNSADFSTITLSSYSPAP